MRVILIFIIATVINVVLSTIRSLCTVNATKTVAALANAVCYGFYTYVIVLTVSDIDLWAKILITAIANFVGVFLVKYVEEKARKDKLWKVEATVKKELTESLHKELTERGIPNNYIANVEEYSIFNCYCATQKESIAVKGLLDLYQAKYFVSETKNL